MKARITKSVVDKIVAPEHGEFILWDDSLTGFGVRVRPGGAKTYIVFYRAGHGRGAPTRKIVLGQHGSPWTPDTARAAAKRLLGQIANGCDPAADKAARRKAATVAELALRFLAEHVQVKRKSRTADEYRRLINKVIVPALGRMKVADVQRNDVLRLQHDLRATPYQANRVLAIISKMTNLAEAWGMRPDGSNPCRHIERYPEEERERMLSVAELGYIGSGLARYGANPYVPAAIKLLLFTGARLNEILTLQWDWIDLERCVVRLPESKTGRKTIHLAAPALAVLNKLPRIKDNRFVIPGQRHGSHLTNLEKPWRLIRDCATVQGWRESDNPAVSGLVAHLDHVLKRDPTPEECHAAAKEANIDLPPGLDDVRLHDLRHAFASVGVMGGSSLPIIGKLLGHTQSQTTQRYAHLAGDPLQAAASAIASRLDAALRESVITMRREKP